MMFAVNEYQLARLKASKLDPRGWAPWQVPLWLQRLVFKLRGKQPDKDFSICKYEDLGWVLLCDNLILYCDHPIYGDKYGAGPYGPAVRVKQIVVDQAELRKVVQLYAKSFFKPTPIIECPPAPEA